MGWALGTDLGEVGVREESSATGIAGEADAIAVTQGREITFGPGQFRPGTFDGDLLLAHELAHVVQQSGRGAAIGAGGEAEADSAALGAVARLRGAGRPPIALRRGGLALQRCTNKAADAAKLLQSGNALSAADARQVLDVYRGLNPTERADLFRKHEASGGVRRLLAAVTSEDAAGTYRLEVSDILRRVQEAATERAAGKTQAELADAQGAFLQSQADAEARAAAAAAGHAPAPPTPAELQAARAQRDQAQNAVRPPAAPQTWYDALPTDVERRAWDARATVAIKKVIDYANSRPDAAALHLTTADFVWDPNAVAKRGGNVLGLGRLQPDRRQIMIGREWLVMAEANPAYALSIAVHESRGHWEYGEAPSTYLTAIYDQAAPKVPGYTRPAGDARTAETDTWGYADTEIYSLLRSAPFHTSPTAADKAAGITEVDPAAAVRFHIGKIHTQWAPTVWPALLRGLYVRLLMDPRITAYAMGLFRTAITAEIPDPERSRILAAP